MSKKTKKNNHYVDNKKLLAALVEHQQNVKDAKDKGLEPPRVSEYIGECVLLIATNMSYSHNFINYPFREEMIMDGVENVIRYSVHNFDPQKYDNPFGYFSFVIWRAFVRRIKTEKQLLDFKKNCVEMTSIGQMDEAYLENHDRDVYFQNTAIEYMQELYDEQNTDNFYREETKEDDGEEETE